MGSVFRQKGRSVWMLKYYQDGRPVYESSGTAIKTEAQKELRKREGAVAEGRPIVLSAKARALTFDSAVKNVENDYEVNGRRSGYDVETRIRLHLTPFFGGRRMSKITTDQIRAYVADRLKAKAKPATINRELAIVKRAFSLAMKDGLLMSKPYIPMLAERNVRKGFFEREQFESVMKHLPKELQPAIAFAFYTGWRVRSEVLPLTWSQVDTVSDTVRLEPGTTKNKQARTFPFGVLPELKAIIEAQEGVRDALKERGIITPFLFPDAQGGALPAFYSKAWREACKLAGTPGKIPHDFRRTAVRNLVRAGVPEKTAMTLTGHLTRSVFDRYDIVNEQDLRAAVSKLAASQKSGAKQAS